MRQWSQILGQDLASDSKCNQFICDQYFEEDYIIRNDVISIPGQKPFVSGRKKIILKRDAIPILNKNIDQVIKSPINTLVTENENVSNFTIILSTLMY